MKTKNLSTQLKIIKILKLMTEKPVSLKEIVCFLEKENSYVNRETISKYFTTLRSAGCNIEKKQNKFYIKYPVLNFTEVELDTLSSFHKTAENMCSKKDYKEFIKFIDKLFTLANNKEILHYKSILTNKNNSSFIYIENFKDKIETISNFMGESSQKIEIIFNKKEYKIIPLKFNYFKESISLLGYDTLNKVNKNFPLNKIQYIKQLPSLAQNTEFGLATTFKITGKLKNSYSIKEGEIVTPYEDYLIVTNNKEDKDELFKRLLKYGTNCEILHSKSDREKFKTMVKTLIATIK